MAFVHSLVRTEAHGKPGWCAPVELGEAAPHYINFVIPVDGKGGFFKEYTCESIVAKGGDRWIESHEFVRSGEDSFQLRHGKLELWFTVRPVPKVEHRLPYFGKLRHPDFEYLFTEIEPDDPDKLDNLYEEEGIFIIGCEPFAHYSGIKRLARKRSV
jgi:hypothetical protein